ncbi:MAG: hypothetical protein KA604_00915 [Candidatus Saccharimonas sp.]|nr:hypothetical protein [Candidatus Saccharimonas sp.]
MNKFITKNVLYNTAGAIILVLGVITSMYSNAAVAATAATVSLVPINTQTGALYSATSSSVTVRCSINPNGDSGQYMSAYKLASASTYSQTSTKYTFPTTSASFTSDITVTNLSPDTDYDFRCRIRANSTTVNSTTTVRAHTMPILNAGISVNKSSLQVSENGSTDSATVVLNSQPSTNVVLNVLSSDTTEGVSSPSTLTFTSSNWNTPQTFTLTGIDDSLVDGNQIYSVAVSVDPALSDTSYASVPAISVSATTTDNDSGQVSSVRLLAAGDVCDVVPSPGILCTDTGNYIRSQLNGAIPTYVLELGDMQYANSNRSEIDVSYGTMSGWGGFADKTISVVGNHEQRSTSTKFNVGGKSYPDGYCRYFDSSNNNSDGYGPLVTLVNPACYPYNSSITSTSNPEYGRGDMSYRIDLGSWSVVSMEATGSVSSAQVQQLNRLLDAAGSDHVVLAIHHPYWASYCANPTDTANALAANSTPPHCHGGESKPISGTQNGSKKYWDVALTRGVDIIAVAHDHKYERFERMNTSGVDPLGIPEFLAGLGGAHPDPGCSERETGSAFCIGQVDVSDPLSSNGNSVDTNGDKYTADSGLLSLILNDDGTYTWEFVDTTNYPSVRSLDPGAGTSRI